MIEEQNDAESSLIIYSRIQNIKFVRVKLQGAQNLASLQLKWQKNMGMRI